MKKWVLLTPLVVSLLSEMPAVATVPNEASNCFISTPPLESGEADLHGAPVRIFPRAANISATYTGCQWMWLQVDNHWQRIARVYYENGRVRSISALLSLKDKEIQTVCEYRQDKLLTESSSECASSPAEFERMKSYPAGCYAKLYSGVDRDKRKECLTPE